MPAKGSYWPNSDRNLVLAWLQSHPGMHTAETVGAAVFPDSDRATHKAAIALRGLWERGDAWRSDPNGIVGGSRVKRGLYGAKTGPAAPAETVGADH